MDKKRKREAVVDEGEADVVEGAYDEGFEPVMKEAKPEKKKKKKGKKMSAMSPEEVADFNAKAANRYVMAACTVGVPRICPTPCCLLLVRLYHPGYG
jgi:hypothetical protein